MQDFKQLRQYFSASDALVAKEILDDQNIRYYTTGENHTILNPLIVPAIGGIRIMVHKDDFEKAKEILEIFEAPADSEEDTDDSDE